MRVLTGLSCSQMGSFCVGAASRGCDLALLEGGTVRSLGLALAVGPDAVLDWGLASGVGTSTGELLRALERTVLTIGAGGSMRLLFGFLTGATF